MESRKSLTVRLPEELIEKLDAESRQRGISRSDVVRERLEVPSAWTSASSSLAAIDDLIGSVEDLPADTSARTKHYLTASGYGRPSHR